MIAWPIDLTWITISARLGFPLYKGTGYWPTRRSKLHTAAASAYFKVREKKKEQEVVEENKRERGRKGRRGTEKGGKGLRLDYCRMAENVKRRAEKRLDVRRKWSLCRRPKLVLERNYIVHMWTIYAVAGVWGSLDKTSRAFCCAGSRIGFNAKNSSVLGLGEEGIWGWGISHPKRPR